MPKSIEMNCLAAVAGVVLVLVGPVRTILGTLAAVGLFCLLIKDKISRCDDEIWEEST